MRFGLGPVFVYEWLIASRRWQMYALRSLLVFLLGVGLTLVWLQEVRAYALVLRDSARVGEFFFYALVGTQLSLLLLAAPAATAGAICHDKSSGALLQLLTTDLSSAEIVLGKLAARLLPILGLLLVSVPVLFGALLLGGIAPEALAGAVLVELGLAILGCSLALALSVWTKKPQEVLLVVYLVWFLVVAGSVLTKFGPLPTRPIALLLEDINPFTMAFLPYMRRGTSALAEQCYYFAGCIVLSMGLTALAIFRLRAATLREWSRGEKPVRARQRSRFRLTGFWSGPRLDPNPVLWREWHRRRPSRWVRTIWIMYVVLTVGSTVTALALSTVPGDRSIAWVSGAQVAIGFLLLIITTTTSLSEERIHGSLDVLLATPLSTRQIVRGKWLASLRTVLLVAAMPILAALIRGVPKLDFAPAALVALAIVTSGTMFTSAGLAIAIWFRRQSRALAMAAGFYILAMAVPFLALFVKVLSFELSELIAIGSPWLNVTALTIWIGERPNPPRAINMGSLHFWAISYVVIYSAAAFALYRFTLATFDRCLGRAAERKLITMQ